MTEHYMLRQMADAKAAIDRLLPDLSWIQEHVEEAARLGRHIEEKAAQLSSPFLESVLQDRTSTYLQEIAEDKARTIAWLKRGRENDMLISAVLPKRGWYLSGQEPCTLSDTLAHAVREAQWDKVDQQMMEHLPQFKADSLRTWLAHEGVPEYCVNRLCRFLKHHDEGNYEEATYLGVPLLDEIAKYLYSGKAFTTKRASRRRSDQSKPELAFKTTSGPDLASYCESFLQAFGSLQQDPDLTLLTDESYWNRHAIVHGLMQRAMGIKDSAKCLMAINFLIFARKEAEIGD